MAGVFSTTLPIEVLKLFRIFLTSSRNAEMFQDNLQVIEEDRKEELNLRNKKSEKLHDFINLFFFFGFNKISTNICDFCDFLRKYYKQIINRYSKVF